MVAKSSRWAAALLLGLINVSAVPVPDALFGDHAVLQRDTPLPIWGTANPGDKITVSYNEATATTEADGTGHWRLQIGPFEGGKQGELVFQDGSGKVTSRDVVTGDVWLCGGQSNMEFTLKKALNAEQEMAAARFPLIRHFKIPPKVSAKPVQSTAGNWVVCAPENCAEFTAVGYFFARELYQNNHQPQGLINCTWGGTAIHTWLGAEALASDPAFRVVSERWSKIVADYPVKKAEFDKLLAAWNNKKQSAEAARTPFTEAKPNPPGGGPDDRNTPSGAFNAMMAPLSPFALKGILWYQGEANWQYPLEYRKQLHALIADWRSRWKSPQLPVLVVQLPDLRGGDGRGIVWAQLREAQASVIELGMADFVVTIGLGERDNIHPANKQDVGKRLALTARKRIFGENIVSSGPIFLSASAQDSGMLIKLDSGGKKTVLLPPKTDGTAFELCGSDLKFYPATAEIVEGGVLVTCPQVPTPIAVRYCYRDYPTATLFNEEGLPAPPFRSDDWFSGK